MKANNLLSKKQFGFLWGRSTVCQLLRLLDEWIDSQDKGICIDATTTCTWTSKKPLIKSPHKRLISQISSYGMAGEIGEWVEAFLLDRMQKVCVNGKASPWAQVTSGIPQGSVIGPVLFILYINDLPNVILNDVYLFVDDMKIYGEISNVNDLKKWLYTWWLAFHPDKCNVLRLGNRTDEVYECKLDQTPLMHMQSEKDLGIVIKNKLKVSEHMDEKVKANSIMGVIRSVIFLDWKSFIKLYIGLVRPHVEYVVAVWNSHMKKDIKRMERAQRRATKQINSIKEMSLRKS